MSAAQSTNPFSKLVRNAFATGGTMSAVSSSMQSTAQSDDQNQSPPVDLVQQPTVPLEPQAQPLSTPQVEPEIDSSTRLEIIDAIVSELSATPIADVSPQPSATPAADLVQPQPQPLQPQPQSAPQPAQQPAQLPQDEVQQPDPQPQQPVSDTLNPPNAFGFAKEKVESTSSPDIVSPDSGAGVQYVEQEKNPEIPVEVESFLQHAEDHANQTPQEIVIADGSQPQSTKHLPKKPVFVLPITEEIEKEGEKKNPKYSIRWLVEWSHKVIKMFAGKVIYREAPSES